MGDDRTPGRRFRLRTVMIVVAVAAVALGLYAHVRSLLRDEDEFAIPVLLLEGFVVSVLGAICFAILRVIRFVIEDDAYATRLRRTEHPDRCPFAGFDANGPDVD
jgi:hypothetical protein